MTFGLSLIEHEFIGSFPCFNMTQFHKLSMVGKSKAFVFGHLTLRKRKLYIFFIAFKSSCLNTILNRLRSSEKERDMNKSSRI